MQPSDFSARFRATLNDWASADGAVTVRLSLEQLLHMHGHASGHALLLLMALLSMVPVAGAGNIMGFGMLTLAWNVCSLGSGVRLPARLRALTLPPRWSHRTVRALAWIYGTADRHFRPRWPLCLHRRTRYWWSAWIALMVLIIFLPIPLGNVLPSLCVMFISLGWMFRDGLALALSMLWGVTAVAYTAAVGGGVWLMVAKAWGA